jgi:transcriptional regulator with XRE-family HTH domain
MKNNLGLPELGAWLRKRRERLGFSQTFVGDALGLDQSAISRIEDGKQALSFREIAILSRVLKFSLASAAKVVLGVDDTD